MNRNKPADPVMAITPPQNFLSLISLIAMSSYCLAPLPCSSLTFSLLSKSPFLAKSHAPVITRYRHPARQMATNVSFRFKKYD